MDWEDGWAMEDWKMIHFLDEDWAISSLRFATMMSNFLSDKRESFSGADFPSWPGGCSEFILSCYTIYNK